MALSNSCELTKVVTAFTVAHSLTLAATGLGFWRPARLMEPLISLNIAYVGEENSPLNSDPV